MFKNDFESVEWNVEVTYGYTKMQKIDEVK